MSAALDGPRIPASGGRADALVVFLHGYGADGNDLIEIGRQWRQLLPGAAFVSPNAPERCTGAPMGRQWFALANRPPDNSAGADERWRGVVKAREPLDAFLDAELRRVDLDKSRLALVGFSQGTMMALHAGLRRRRARRRFSAIPAFSSGKVNSGEAVARNSRLPPPILLVHGDQDPLIPLEAMFLAADALARAVPTQWHISFGTGHGIDGGGLKQGGEFLAQSLRRKGRGFGQPGA